MSEFIDASLLLRFLTGQPPETATLARRIVESGVEPLYLTEVALAEVLWTLDRGQNRYPREVVVNQMQDLFRFTRLRVWGLGTPQVLRALEFCRPNRRVSFGDALIWAQVYEDGGTLYTLDERFPSDGITILSDVQEETPSE
jgi:predicted nucleic acid-binding protein